MKPAIKELIKIYKGMLKGNRSKIRRDLLENVIEDLEQLLRDAQ